MPIFFVRDVGSWSRMGSRVIVLCEAFLIEKVFFSFGVPKGRTLFPCSKSVFVDGFGVSMGLLRGRGLS